MSGGPNSFVQVAPDGSGKQIDNEVRNYGAPQGLPQANSGDVYLQRVILADGVGEAILDTLRMLLAEAKKQTFILQVLVNDDFNFNSEGDPE
jgi:hypothetical protein